MLLIGSELCPRKLSWEKRKSFGAKFFICSIFLSYKYEHHVGITGNIAQHWRNQFRLIVAKEGRHFRISLLCLSFLSSGRMKLQGSEHTDFFLELSGGLVQFASFILGTTKCSVKRCQNATACVLKVKSAEKRSGQKLHWIQIEFTFDSSHS